MSFGPRLPLPSPVMTRAYIKYDVY